MKNTHKNRLNKLKKIYFYIYNLKIRINILHDEN